MDPHLNVIWWSKQTPTERARYIEHIIRMYDESVDEDMMMRVEIDRTTGRVVTLPLFTQKKAKTRAYASLDNLPKYLRDGVLMLDMMGDIPITDRTIDGIGQMVTKNVYWIKPREIEDGDDT